eukprot:GILK01000946.1.p1 GENE.GILK01000946.1~~GILK01000946.1.p1  ORF type:complete len:536 (+),score=74.75 GILK01000946.1:208-1815(+)
MSSPVEVKTVADTNNPQAGGLEGDALKDALKKQLEHYFSKQNLYQDPYLMSQMNTQMFVPLAAVAALSGIVSLTTDTAAIIQAIKSIPTLVLDDQETMVKPNIKVERNTLILREIPASTKEEEVRSIFASHDAGNKIIKIHPDVADTWFITFESEDVCLDVALWLRSQQFQGKPIRSAVKSESLLRSFFPLPGSQPAQPHDPSQPNPYAQQNAYRGNMYQGGQYPRMPYGYAVAGSTPQWNDGGDYAARGGRGGAKRPPRGSYPTNQPVSNSGRGGRGGQASGGRGGRDNRPRTKSVDKAMPQIGSPPTSVLRLNPENFPPLPTASKSSSVPKAGYQGEFTKYSKDEVMNVFMKLRSVSKPDFLAPAHDIPIILNEPNSRLEITASPAFASTRKQINPHDVLASASEPLHVDEPDRKASISEPLIKRPEPKKEDKPAPRAWGPGTHSAQVVSQAPIHPVVPTTPAEKPQSKPKSEKKKAPSPAVQTTPKETKEAEPESPNASKTPSYADMLKQKKAAAAAAAKSPEASPKSDASH